MIEQCPACRRWWACLAEHLAFVHQEIVIGWIR